MNSNQRANITFEKKQRKNNFLEVKIALIYVLIEYIEHLCNSTSHCSPRN